MYQNTAEESSATLAAQVCINNEFFGTLNVSPQYLLLKSYEAKYTAVAGTLNVRDAPIPLKYGMRVVGSFTFACECVLMVSFNQNDMILTGESRSEQLVQKWQQIVYFQKGKWNWQAWIASFLLPSY